MNDKINKAMDEEILSRLEDLKQMDVSSKEYEKSVDVVTKMYSQRTEEYKVECDFYSKEHDAELKEKEAELKERESNPLNMNRIIDVSLRGLEIVVPVIFTGVWMGRCLKFEETGTFTSQVSKNLIPKFRK